MEGVSARFPVRHTLHIYEVSDRGALWQGKADAAVRRRAGAEVRWRPAHLRPVYLSRSSHWSACAPRELCVGTYLPAAMH
jgi:hypothetical protein